MYMQLLERLSMHVFDVSVSFRNRPLSRNKGTAKKNSLGLCCSCSPLKKILIFGCKFCFLVTDSIYAYAKTFDSRHRVGDFFFATIRIRQFSSLSMLSGPSLLFATHRHRLRQRMTRGSWVPHQRYTWRG